MWSLFAFALAFAQPSSTAPPPAAPPVPSAEEIVRGVQRYYQDTDKLEAKFKQTFTNVVFGKSSKSVGRVFLQKPGKMRWDYHKPHEKYFISDGKTLWVYEPMHRQAFQQDLAEQILPVAVTFLYGKGDLLKDFHASLDHGKFGGRSSVVVKLVPKQPSAQYKHLWLVVDPSDYHVEESIIQETSDNLNHFKFYDIKKNEKTTFTDRHFKFKPPKGVKVVRPPTER